MGTWMRFVLAAALGAPLLAAAQNYPAKPIRVVMSVSGGAEVIMRIVGQKLTETFGQPVLIDIQSAAAGAVGAEMVAKAPPDGYTLLLGKIGRAHV